MITITETNKTFRNLEEQVAYLSEFHQESKALASWGIRIIGQVTNSAELPDHLTFDGEYGDTYAVGEEAPYSYWIWTRASQTGGSDHWFDFGEISIAGPQGPIGPQGPKGNTGESSKWYALFGAPTSSASYKDGDMGLLMGSTINQDLIGNVYRYSNGQWNLLMNIKGPQGPVGPRGERGLQGPTGAKGNKGDRGDTGGLVNIVAKLAAGSTPPAPSTLNNLTLAYIIGDDLYIQVGSTSQNAQWLNMGPLNVATLVTVNGQY